MSEPYVGVCIPSGGAWEARFGYDLVMACTRFASMGGKLRITQVQGSILPRNRADLVEENRKAGVSHLMWFDDDMRFPIDVIPRLLHWDVDIVCANYRMRNTPTESTVTGLDGAVIFSREQTGLEEVARAGMGVMLTTLKVFDAIEKPYFMFGYVQDENYYVGEDVLLCQKWREAGFSIFIDHDLSKEVGHINDFTIKSDGLIE